MAGAPTGGWTRRRPWLRAGHALLLDTLDAAGTRVPFDLAGADLELLVIDARAEHAPVDGHHAARCATCHAGAARLGVGTLREVTDRDAALEALTDARNDSGAATS